MRVTVALVGIPAVTAKAVPTAPVIVRVVLVFAKPKVNALVQTPTQTIAVIAAMRAVPRKAVRAVPAGARQAGRNFAQVPMRALTRFTTPTTVVHAIRFARRILPVVSAPVPVK
jgi:hypothetical protein